MWIYNRSLQYPVKIKTRNPKAILNDIGTEELAHLEMVGSIVNQLTEGSSIEEIKKAGMEPYYTDHGVGLEYILKEFK